MADAPPTGQAPVDPTGAAPCPLRAEGEAEEQAQESNRQAAAGRLLSSPDEAVSGGRHLDCRWLEDFLSLVETRNFSRSAEKRCATQSAFSRRIRSLEDWVGVPLFDRTEKPVSFTPAGERFRPYAEAVLRRLYQGRDEARRELDSAANTIRFAAAHSLSLNFFPDWLRNIEVHGQAFNTRLDTAPFNESIKLLVRGASHFLISYTHPRIPMRLPKESFVGKLVLRDRLVPVTLPDKAGRALDRLPGTPDEPAYHVAYSDASAIGCLVEEFLLDQDEPVYLKRVFVSQMVAIVKAMSAEGRGMAWLPESHLSAELAAGSLVLAGGEKWCIPVGIRLIRSRESLPAVAEAFWASLDAPEDTDWG